MEITWLGGSATRIFSGDVVLIADPSDEMPPGVEARVAVVSNRLAERSAVYAVAGEPRRIDGPGQYEVLGYNIVGIGSALSAAEGERRVNTIYVIRREGLSVALLGELSDKPNARQMRRIGEVDVLIAPSAAGEALGTKRMSELVNALSPGIFIPIGYESDGPLDALLRELNVERPDAQPRLNVTRSNLPRQTRTVILQQSRRR